MEYIRIPGSIFSAGIEINHPEYGSVSRTGRYSIFAGFYLTDKIVRLNKAQNAIMDEMYREIAALSKNVTENGHDSTAIEKLHIAVVGMVDRLNTAIQNDPTSIVVSTTGNKYHGHEEILNAFTEAQVFGFAENQEGGCLMFPMVDMSTSNCIEHSH